MRVSTLALALLSLSACARSPAEPEGAAAVRPAAPEAIDVRLASDAKTLREAIAGLRGKTVLVNFWATWCPPCLAEFPALVEVSEAYRDRGVTLVTVSGDKPADLESKVKPFLAEHRQTENAWLLDVDDTNAFIDAFHRPWDGTFPATFVYDVEGELAEFVTGEQSREAFEALVRKHLPRQ